MNPAELSIKNRLICTVTMLLFLFGGWQAYQTMPRLEDPDFTIRIAAIITQYPGATPVEVANEVSDKIESALQQMPEVKEIRSTSTMGLSTIEVEIKYEFSPKKSDLAAIWTKVRNKVADAALQMPPGAGKPFVNDDFGAVYGIYYVLTSDGFSPREMMDYAKSLRTDLLAVDGVGKVFIQGELPEAIYIELSQEQIAASGATIEQIFDQLSKQSSVTASGSVVLGTRRLTVQLPDTKDSVETIENTVVSVGSEGGAIIRLGDVAKVTRGYQDPTKLIMRFNGRPALGIGISQVPGENVVRVGELISARLAILESERPIGLELETYYHQGEIVKAAVKDFAINVLIALVIVLVTLTIFMGVSSALVIGVVLILTIAATLTVMNLAGIPMHRISLGALIIALGMLVDNAVVVTDGILVGVRAGRKKLEMAREIIANTWLPLIGGTIVGIIAFAPIGLSPGQTAEYTGSLFWVILISLSFSWVFAMTIAPLFADLLFKESAEGAIAKPESAFNRLYKRLIVNVLRLRYLVLAVVVGLFAVSVVAFGYVLPGFFPTSTTPQIVVDFWLPEGTSIEQTDSDMKSLAHKLEELSGITTVHSLIGGGTLRYMLVYSPQSPTSSYGQILIKVEEYEMIDGLIPPIQAYIDAHYPDAQAKVWRFQLGPGGGSKIVARFLGPDPVVLRNLSAQATAIMARDSDAISIKDDWRQPVSVVEPLLNETRARRLGVTREDVSSALNVNFSGRNVGVMREGDKLIPIVQRAPASERLGIGAIGTIQVSSQVSGATIPLRQLVDGFRTIWRDGKLKRVNRVWAIEAKSDPSPNILSGDLFKRLRPQIEAIPLPPGYELVWKGEYGDSASANGDLASTLPMGFVAMVLVVLLLFNAIRQPLLIFLTLPLAIIGVVFGLIVMRTPLEFMAIVGVLSLSGLMLKNAIVLVDQMDLEIRQGKPRFDAIVDSAASRVRPVLLGSVTTVLGVMPLLTDAFFRSLAVVLIYGLSFATVLTLIVIPALYAVFFQVKSDERASAS